MPFTLPHLQYFIMHYVQPFFCVPSFSSINYPISGRRAGEAPSASPVLFWDCVCSHKGDSITGYFHT